MVSIKGKEILNLNAFQNRMAAASTCFRHICMERKGVWWEKLMHAYKGCKSVSCSFLTVVTSAVSLPGYLGDVVLLMQFVI